MEKSKICFVIPSLQAGGMERVMSELARYFGSLDHVEAHLILYGLERGIFYSVPQNITIHTPSFTFNNSTRLSRAINSLKTMLFLRKVISTISPRCILSFGEVWNNFVIFSCLGMDINIYISDRCQPDKNLSFIQETMRRILYPTVRGIIVQSKLASHIYLRKFKCKNIYVIGNPIRSIQSDRLIVRENIVLSVGRLIHTKHYDELIRMFLRIYIPGWKLIIIGDDALKQRNMVKLEALVTSFGASDKVELVGQRADVDDFYLRSKIFAFTSSSEGFPNVIGEAMSAGLPVVSFDCVAGPSEMIRDGENGYLVPLFDFILFEKRLSRLMKDESLREELGNHARNDIRSFSIEAICKKFYNTILLT